MKPLTVIARIQAKPDTIEIVREELKALVNPTMKEEGVINYDLHQDKDDPTIFMFHENWETEAALEKHSQSAHLKAFREKSEHLLDGEIVLNLLYKVD
ncbi:MAG: putative quinol monooxygenase [Verrucomicrobiota bacterium]